nr:basic proline-rich protein-like [Penaeus vannamei]
MRDESRDRNHRTQQTQHPPSRPSPSTRPRERRPRTRLSKKKTTKIQINQRPASTAQSRTRAPHPTPPTPTLTTRHAHPHPPRPDSDRCRTSATLAAGGERKDIAEPHQPNDISCPQHPASYVVGAPCWCLPGPVQAGGVPEGGCFMSGVVVVGFGSNPYPFKNPGVGGLCATPPTPGVGGGILHPCAEGPAVPGSPQAPTPPSPLAPTPGPPLLPLQRAAHDSAGPLGAFVHPSLSNRARAGGTPPRGGGWGGAGQLPARGPAAGPTCAPTPPAPLPAPVSPTPPYSTRLHPSAPEPQAPVGWVGDRGRALRPVARWPRARWLGAFRTPGLPSRPARCAGEARAAARPYSTPATPLALHPFSASRAPVVHPAPSLHPPPLLPSTPSAAAQGPAVPCRVRATSDARGADPLPLSALCASRTHCPSPLPLRPRPSDPGRSAAGCARPRPYPPLQPAASPPRRRVTALRRPHPLATPSEPAHPACHPVRPVRYCEKREDRLAGELFMRQSGRFRVEGGRDREGSRRAASESQAARAARRSLCCFGPGFRCCCVRLWCNARGRAFAVSESRLLPGGCMMAQLCGMVVYAY